MRPGTEGVANLRVEQRGISKAMRGIRRQYGSSNLPLLTIHLVTGERNQIEYQGCSNWLAFAKWQIEHKAKSSTRKEVQEDDADNGVKLERLIRPMSVN